MATELLNLSEIFNRKIFRVPDYQRGYAWGARQLIDFWSDVGRIKESARSHYCGQLTVEPAAEAEWRLWDDASWLIKQAAFRPFMLIDGQQRLATALIMLQGLVDGIADDVDIAGEPVSGIRRRFLVHPSGLNRACLFGYSSDTHSHEFYRTQVLGVPSTEYSGVRTTYTANLSAACSFFRDRLLDESASAKAELYRCLVQQVRFNVHELSADTDVFVTFETMNNRGRSLSRLELLKNRLIYLCTEAVGVEDAERVKVRADVNATWRTIYAELGYSATTPMNDDDFLRAHWIVYFGYSKGHADPLVEFLLNTHFTIQRLDAGKLSLADIREYVTSLQSCVRFWRQINLPSSLASDAPVTAAALERLVRLDSASIRPLILAALLAAGEGESDLDAVLFECERFLLLARGLAKARADAGQTDLFRAARELSSKNATLRDVALALAQRTTRHATPAAIQARVDDLFVESRCGFYDWPQLRFVLFEYESALQRRASSEQPKVFWAGIRLSIEHIYPQQPADGDWPQFDGLPDQERHNACHSLGNMLLLAHAKNAGLSNKSFAAKCDGYAHGSFSETDVATRREWNVGAIRERGLAILAFIEKQWNVDLGSLAAKTGLLKLTPEPGDATDRDGGPPDDSPQFAHNRRNSVLSASDDDDNGSVATDDGDDKGLPDAPIDWSARLPKIAEMRKAGHTDQEIGNHFGTSRQWIADIIKRNLPDLTRLPPEAKLSRMTGRLIKDDGDKGHWWLPKANQSAGERVVTPGTARRVWQAERGEDPGRIYRHCDDVSCVRPDHWEKYAPRPAREVWRARAPEIAQKLRLGTTINGIALDYDVGPQRISQVLSDLRAEGLIPKGRARKSANA